MSMIFYLPSEVSVTEFTACGLSGRVPKGVKNPLCLGLSRRLQRIHERSGCTFREVSDRAELSNGVAGKIASGGNIPALDTLERISAALGISPGWVAYGYEGLEPYRERYPRPLIEPADPVPDLSLRSFRALYLCFPVRLAQARERSGLSMRTLSSAAGISVQSWSNAEAGKAIPRVDTCERMAVALGVAPRWLAYGEERSN